MREMGASFARIFVFTLGAGLFSVGPALAGDAGFEPLHLIVPAEVPCPQPSLSISLDTIPLVGVSPPIGCLSYGALADMDAAALNEALAWNGTYLGVDFTVGLGRSMFQDEFGTVAVLDDTPLRGSLDYRGFTLGATYFGDPDEDLEHNYNIDLSYRIGSFEIGAGYLHSEADINGVDLVEGEASQAHVDAFALNLDYAFTSTLWAFAKYLKSVQEVGSAINSAGGESAWSIGFSLGF